MTWHPKIAMTDTYTIKIFLNFEGTLLLFLKRDYYLKSTLYYKGT